MPATSVAAAAVTKIAAKNAVMFAGVRTIVERTLNGGDFTA